MRYRLYGSSPGQIGDVDSLIVLAARRSLPHKLCGARPGGRIDPYSNASANSQRTELPGLPATRGGRLSCGRKSGWRWPRIHVCTRAVGGISVALTAEVYGSTRPIR